MPELGTEIPPESDELLALGFASIPVPGRSVRRPHPESNGTGQSRPNSSQPNEHASVSFGPAEPASPLVVFVGIPDKDISAALSFAKASLKGLKVGASPDDVQRVARDRGLEVSELHDTVVYASAPARRRFPLVAAKWLMQFRFETGDRLASVFLRRGVTAP